MTHNPILLPDDGMRVTHAGTTKDGSRYVCRQNSALLADVIAERAHRQSILTANFRRFG